MSRIKLRWMATALAVAGLAVAPIAERAWAGKPGGGGGGPVDSGTIYAGVETPSGLQIVSMNPDGSGKTMLPVSSWSSALDVSFALHGGHRWFLAPIAIPGETLITGFRKDELAAIRDDGTSVRLTYSGPELRMGRMRWAPGDSRVCWNVARWSGTRWADDGVYMADVAFDAAGNVTGLTTSPTAPTIPSANSSPGFSTRNFNWSPDGSRLVLEEMGDDGSVYYALRVVDIATGASTPLAATRYATQPAWSPNGLLIAYCSGEDAGGIRTVRPDGSGDAPVLASGYQGNIFKSYAYPRWSPNGLNLAVSIYQSGGRSEIPGDVGRCLPTGGTVTLLTSDTSSSYSLVVGWR